MTAKEARAKAVQIGKKRYKLNSYTQGSKRKYVGGYPVEGDGVRGYSDCSAFVAWALQKVLGYSLAPTPTHRSGTAPVAH
jgi:cell wall-associated NlpC family hydrolase